MFRLISAIANFFIDMIIELTQIKESVANVVGACNDSTSALGSHAHELKAAADFDVQKKANERSRAQAQYDKEYEELLNS